MRPSVRVDQLLKQAGLLDEYQLQSASAYQNRWGCPLSRAVVELGFASEPTVMSILAQKLGVPYRAIGTTNVPADVVRVLPEKLIRLRKVFPLGLGASRRGPIVIATADPQDLTVLDEVAFVTGKAVEPVLTSQRDIECAIERHLGAAADPRRAA